MHMYVCMDFRVCGGGGREYTRVLILLCIYMLTWMIQEIHHSSSTMQVKRETHLSSDIWLADSRMNRNYRIFNLAPPENV
jgi:hypothetical protein